MMAPRGATAGYRAHSDINRNADQKEKKDRRLDHKFDVHSLGATAAVLQTKEGSPNISKSQWVDKLIGGDLTGALGRLFKQMTAKEREDRITLEAALNSSYIKNTDAYAEDDLKQLGKLSTQYGKLAKKQLPAIREALKALRPDLYAMLLKFEKDPTKWSFKDVMARLSKQINEERRTVAELTKKLKSPDTADSEKFDLETKIREIQGGIVKIQEAMRDGESPEMKQLASELKTFSDKILRPTSDKSDEEALRQLESTLSSGAEFANLVGLTSMGGLFASWGVKHARVKELAAFLREDMSATAGAAELVYLRAHREIKEFLAGLTNRTAAACLGKGFQQVLKVLAQDYAAAHQDTPPDISKFGDEEGLGVEDYKPSLYLDATSISQATSEIKAVAGDANKFAAYVSDPARASLLRYCQVKQEDVLSAIAIHNEDMSATRGTAEIVFVQAFQQIRKLLGAFKQPAVAKALKPGFQTVLDAVAKRYAAEHDDQEPDLESFGEPKKL